MSTVPASSYGQLSRKDLAAFDQESKELILKAIDAGCIARISAKGHCILRNNSGGTASMPRHLTAPNRTAQNARADLKRLLAEQQKNSRVRASTSETRAGSKAEPTSVITVADAFTSYGAAFSRWFDQFPDGLEPSTKVRATSVPGQGPRFEIVDNQEGHPTDHPTTSGAPVSMRTDGHLSDPVRSLSTPGKTTTPAEPVKTPRHQCPNCDRSFDSRTALTGHRRIHRLPDITPDGITAKDLADANSLAIKTVRARLRSVNSVSEHGHVIVAITAAQAAGLTLPDGAEPTRDEAASSNQTVPQEQPSQDEDPQAVLDEIRAALGPDPRITELEERIRELENELAQHKSLAEEAQTRLTLIRDAMNV